VFKALSPWFGLSLCTLGYLGTTNDLVFAQVTSDQTVNTQVTENGNTAEITGGETRGNNLFHSFEAFSVKTVNEAFFNNADSISNIFSRVTGGNVSDIDGAIRANGSANLFLINPAGIVFGKNASLNIGGSFYGSSASSILFEDGEFSAADLDNPPLLTVNAPIGLGFRDQPGDIVNRSTANGVGLQVFSGKTINLIGGDINFDGGIATAPGGIIELGGLAGTGTVNLGEQGDFSFPDNPTKSNVLLFNNAIVDISSSGGGLIRVNANNLELIGASQFSADIDEGVGSENAVAGTIEVNSNTFSAANDSLIHSDNLGIGKAGTVNITTDTLNLTDGSAITSSTFGVGDAGTINVTAQNITLDQEFTGIYSNVGLTNIASESLDLNVDGVVGIGGVVNVDTDTLSLKNGARIMSSSIAQGNGGAVNINATGAVSFIGQGNTPIQAFGDNADNVVISGSFSQVQQDTGNGNAGEVNITADSLSLIDKGAVLVDNSGVGGDAGNITLEIQDRIFLNQGALIISQIQGNATGNGGEITINADSLVAKGGSQILADTKGQGDGGNITIDAEEQVLLEGISKEMFPSQIVAGLGENAKGKGGNIEIKASELALADAAFISANNTSNSFGQTGSIKIEAERIELTQNALINVLTSNNSDAGIITLNAQTLDLFSGGKILAVTDGEGDAGNINLDISGNIRIDNSIKSSAEFVDFGSELQSSLLLNNLQQSPSGLYADVTENATGSGGDINIKANSLFLDNAQISASTRFGQGGEINLNIVDNLTLDNESIISAEAEERADGGNLKIDSSFIIAYPDGNNDILANAEQGAGGNITINAESVFGIEERSLNDSTNDINASSEFDLDGTINIDTSDINPLQGVTELPSDVIEAKQTTAQTCSVNREGKANNSLAIAGKGGISPAPDTPLNSENISNENPSQASIPQPLETSQGKIQPAMGIKVTKSGKIVLTAYRTDNAGERIPNIKTSCN
jgi:filamentous hemagglutinin family protein